MLKRSGLCSQCCMQFCNLESIWFTFENLSVPVWRASLICNRIEYASAFMCWLHAGRNRRDEQCKCGLWGFGGGWKQGGSGCQLHAKSKEICMHLLTLCRSSGMCLPKNSGCDSELLPTFVLVNFEENPPPPPWGERGKFWLTSSLFEPYILILCIN